MAWTQIGIVGYIGSTTFSHNFNTSIYDYRVRYPQPEDVVITFGQSDTHRVVPKNGSLSINDFVLGVPNMTTIGMVSNVSYYAVI